MLSVYRKKRMEYKHTGQEDGQVVKHWSADSGGAYQIQQRWQWWDIPNKTALTGVVYTGSNSADSRGVYRIQQRWQWWVERDPTALKVVGSTGSNNADSSGIYRMKQRWQWWGSPDPSALTVVGWTWSNSADSGGVYRIQQRWRTFAYSLPWLSLSNWPQVFTEANAPWCLNDDHILFCGWYNVIK